MQTVQTVTGEIEADELGRTLIHEHFYSSDEAVSVQWPHVRDREAEHGLAVESAEAVKAHGVRTVVEPTAMLLGRDIQASRELAEETGLQIIVCTGIYTYDHLPQFLLNRDADYIASLFVHDIEEGIQNTEVKAAFIKCAADEISLRHLCRSRSRLQVGASLCGALWSVLRVAVALVLPGAHQGSPAFSEKSHGCFCLDVGDSGEGSANRVLVEQRGKVRHLSRQRPAVGIVDHEGPREEQVMDVSRRPVGCALDEHRDEPRRCVRHPEAERCPAPTNRRQIVGCVVAERR